MKSDDRPAHRATTSGIPLEPFYRGEPNVNAGERPGEFPFTRGIHANMYRDRLWTMRQYSGFGDPKATNERFRYLLAEGQTGLSMAFDLPTQIGYDSDHPLAAGEVGRVGVPISCVADLAETLEGIPLETASISMTINASAAVLLAFLVVVAERRGVSPDRLRGTIQNDILKEFTARRTYRFPLGPSMRLATDAIEHCVRRLPRFYPISVSGYHIREAGSDAAQEIAFTLLDGFSYLDAARARGLDAATVAARLTFFFNAQMHLFEEVAKFRAARRLWAMQAKARFGIADPEALKLRFHAQTAGSALTFQDPWNNVVRVTVQALAAILGGAQSLHTNALDEALHLPTAETARLALRTQQVLAYETGAADVADPLGGSHLVESLTRELEERATKLIDEIDRTGGMLAAIESGRIQRAIEESAYRAQREIERGDRVIVGVNRYRRTETEGTVPQQEKPDDLSESNRHARLRALRRSRTATAAAATVENLKRAARGSENLVPAIVECARCDSTLGEIMGALAEVFGEAPAGV